ncbi:MAG: IscS subfamily cysteine desulfurase [Candidatus Contendobacter odensis]|uniref:cysteine desulfurase n=1 Tax=Candidatus Contendibacter odensensis TaxID=1400860 RepID=A0A2G6PGM4_9GAMM|nr:MAG: IscS subfamily cysteine desulfurase [Candidatus Contendobacter odensis]
MPVSIYLDYAATTPMDSRVAACLGQYLACEGQFGNPSSSTHVFGRSAAQAVATAREQVAALLHADSREIIWTSGATEANNLALQGVMKAYARQGRHLVTAKTEHKAILDVCRQLEREGCRVTWLNPEQDGLIPPEQVAAALQSDTVLVSLMHVNNETGVIQDLATISALTRERGVLLHVDAAQSAGKLPIDTSTLPADLISLSAHKFYGPKGIGALYVRQHPRQVRLEPLMFGGGQERGLRAGTLPTHQIVAMGEACRIAAMEMEAEQQRIRSLRDGLWQALSELGHVTLNGHTEYHVAGILNVGFNGIAAEALLSAVPEIAVSTGSACTSAGNGPSHVLQAMGRDEFQARSAVRFSLGRFTTAEEMDHTACMIGIAVKRLRKLSPLWGLQQRGLTTDVVDWAALP